MDSNAWIQSDQTVSHFVRNSIFYNFPMNDIKIG